MAKLLDNTRNTEGSQQERGPEVDSELVVKGGTLLDDLAAELLTDDVAGVAALSAELASPDGAEDAEPAAAQLAAVDLEEDEEDEDEPAVTPDADISDIDDPVRLYLREIARVPLLTDSAGG